MRARDSRIAPPAVSPSPTRDRSGGGRRGTSPRSASITRPSSTRGARAEGDFTDRSDLRKLFVKALAFTEYVHRRTQEGVAMKRSTRRRTTGLVTLLAASVALIAAASAAQGSSLHSAGATRAAVKAHSSRYGKILFDGRGRVLYLFARDRGGRSSCSGA